MTRKKFTDEFRKEAVQLALISGLILNQVADDPGMVIQHLVNGSQNTAIQT